MFLLVKHGEETLAAKCCVSRRLGIVAVGAVDFPERLFAGKRELVGSDAYHRAISFVEIMNHQRTVAREIDKLNPETGPSCDAWTWDMAERILDEILLCRWSQ